MSFGGKEASWEVPEFARSVCWSTKVSGMRVLLLGATGGCGRQVLTRLLGKGIETTVIVRDAARLPEGASSNALLTVVVEPCGHLANESRFVEIISGCDSVVSCLGHTLSLAGVFGEPRRLCRDTTVAVFSAINAITPPPPRPIKYVVLNSEGVDHPGGADAVRGRAERFVLWLLWKLLPPHSDNVAVVEYLHAFAGSTPRVEFCAPRPSDLVDTEETAYTLHATLQNGLFNPGTTARANVGAFVADLVTESRVWEQWRGKYPQILDVKKAKTKDA